MSDNRNTNTNKDQRPSAPAVIAALQATLIAEFAPSVLEITDDSHLHVGHAGAKSGGHFSIKIRCAAFNEMTLLARHRAIYNVLGNLPERGIHALAIDAAGIAEP